MRRAVLADLHLGQVPGDLERFAELLEALPKAGVGEVVLGGDVFRTLVGIPRFWSAAVTEGLAALRRLRQRGVRLVWVEGNREFFLHTRAMAPYLDRFLPAYGFAAGGRRFLVEHGDLINRADRWYFFWRALSKSRWAYWWARSLPQALAQRIVVHTEQALGKTNFAHRRHLPVEDLQQEACRHFACGVDVVFWGHFHRFWSFRQGSQVAFALPAWQDTGTVVFVEPDGTFSFQPEAGHFVDNGVAFCYQG
ncbi:MAG: metallophosphoesterase [Thermoanaerobaculum sp.]|nr:metallophosphoesterase [Thermoanaerobaculum sp.]MDW7968198.1 metallophosphoesterase [Thermoanaerobaculum sp.]